MWRTVLKKLLPFPSVVSLPISPLTPQNRSRIFQECYQLSLQVLPTSSPVSFTLDVRSSSIPGSNDGVYLKGCVKKGTILALYSGVYYPPLPICAVGAPDGSYALSAADVRHMWDQNEYIIHLANSGGYLDGKNVSSSIFSGTNSRPFNSYAVAQMVNHPSKIHHPNVISLDFYWEDVYSLSNGIKSKNQNPILSFQEYSKIVPTRLGDGPWYVDPSTEEVIQIGQGNIPCRLAGLAFMALEDLSDGAELFFDYKLPLAHRPSWYHVPEYTPSIPDH